MRTNERTEPKETDAETLMRDGTESRRRSKKGPNLTKEEQKGSVKEKVDKTTVENKGKQS